MIQIRRYTALDASCWDAFVEDSKNGTFLFCRGYMDYHSDRFEDHSLLFFDHRDQLVGLLPANRRGNTLYSHQGLTYGGLVLSVRTTAGQVLAMFDALKTYARAQGFDEIVYKSVPTVYHRCPAEEDEYALWRQGAEQVSCLISTAIPLTGDKRPEVERRRRRGRTRAEETGCRVEANASLAAFWPIMERNLRERYDVAPVHSLAEMQLLQSRFPARIRCYRVCTPEGEDVAGCVVYLANAEAVHVQYGHATPEGKQMGALDMLYLTLIRQFAGEGYRFFDFGNSNEDGGRYLNESLIAQKEGFGGRGIVYRTYRLDLRG